ncbi:MAG: YraN family protein [Clostridia bacterium]|nr:YraN family protein [Clostridia bacterium]
MKGKRTQKRRLGDKGERRTARYLMLRGYRVLERNYTFGHKEIDLIVKRGRVIAFVEVKTRTASVVAPAASVTSAKRRNVITAAKAYLRSNPYSGCVIRFDISEVPAKGPINYIKNAFQGE